MLARAKEREREGEGVGRGSRREIKTVDKEINTNKDRGGVVSESYIEGGGVPREAQIGIDRLAVG